MSAEANLLSLVYTEAKRGLFVVCLNGKTSERAH